MSGHRRPPTPHWKSPRGQCRWCGKAILKPDGTTNSRRRWHEECASAYKLAAWSSEQRQQVYERDKGVCAGCGIDTLEEWKKQFPSDDWRSKRKDGNRGELWQADHIRPLVNGNGQDLSYFALENLQTLCTLCHKTKCKREAQERACSRKHRTPIFQAQPELTLA